MGFGLMIQCIAHFDTMRDYTAAMETFPYA
jgi:hypothetical protein